MKVILITDQHIGARNDNLSFVKYFKKFYDEVFFPYIDKHDITTIINLGDMFDRRKYVNFNTLHFTKETWLEPLRKRNINVHCLIGNHDTYFKNTNDINSCNLLFDEYENIHVYPEPEVIDFGGVSVLFMPWMNSENYSECVKYLQQAKADICFGHLELSGFEQHKGHWAQQGYDKDLFKRFELVFSGHYHRKSDDGQIYYLGSPYEMTWSDYECPKGFHVFDLDTRELTRIQNPHRIHKKIYFDDKKNNYDEHDITQYKECYVKVIVVNKTDFYKFDKFADKLMNDSGAYEVKIIEDFSEINAENVSDEIMENTEDTMHLVEKYIDDIDTDLDKNRLKDIMKSLYVEASDLDVGNI